jgi:ribonuclease HII
MPDFSFEDKCGETPVCGVDEVGRGPLAGPVVAAAVILDRARMPDGLAIAIDDSKKLTARKRAELTALIHGCAHVAVATLGVEVIDRINILQASLLAMKQAIEALSVAPAVALIDGNKAPKLVCKALTIVKGDSLSLSIAAASIVAKHHRDTLMGTYAIEFPYYGWDRNAGYGTANHLKAIQIHGVTPLHRRSFAPVSNYLLKVNSAKN